MRRAHTVTNAILYDSIQRLGEFQNGAIGPTSHADINDQGCFGMG